MLSQQRGNVLQSTAVYYSAFSVGYILSSKILFMTSNRTTKKLHLPMVSTAVLIIFAAIV
jgi:hypothetical protein